MLSQVAVGAVRDAQQQRVVLLVRFDGHHARGGRQRRRDLVDRRAVGEEAPVVHGAAREERHRDVPPRTPALDHLQELPERRQLVQQPLEPLAGELLPLAGETQAARTARAPDQPALEVAVVPDVMLAPSAFDAVQRRLRDVDVSVGDQIAHLAVEEREQQRPDVRAVHVGVGHDHDPVVPELREVEVLLADPAAERRDHRLDLVAAQHLVEPRLLDVQDLPLDREHRLEPAVPPLLGRSAGRLAFDDEQLAPRRVALLAVGQLAGKRAVVERPLAPHEIARLAGRLAGPCGLDRLVDDPFGGGRVLLQVRSELVVENRLHDPLDFGVAQLRLGLPFELRLGDLDADDGDQPFADVVAADALLEVLGQVLLVRVGVDRVRQRRAEAGQMGAALPGVDVVGERVDRVGVAVVPLERDLRVDAVPRAADVDRRVVDGRLVLVEELDERDDPPFVPEAVLLARSLVLKGYRHAGVQERELAQPVRQGVEAEVDALEDPGVRTERDLGPSPLRRADNLEVAGRRAAHIPLAVDASVAPDFEVELLRERVHHRDADAVQPARNLVRLAVELASGVQHGHDDLRRRPAARMLIDRNPPAVVGDGDRVVDVDGDADGVAEAGQRLVYRVVDDFVDEVVEAGRAGGPDVHRRAFPHGFESLQHLDLVGAVVLALPLVVGGGGSVVRNRELGIALLLVELRHLPSVIRRPGTVTNASA